MNAEQWQNRVEEVGFVQATKELVASTLVEEPATRAEVKELKSTVDEYLKLAKENAKRIEKLEKANAPAQARKD